MNEPRAEAALAHVVAQLRSVGRPFALVGGLGVSLRAEVRFTRDVDLAVAVADDADAEALVRELCSRGYGVIAQVEHEARKRLATIRLRSPAGTVVDLLTASSGIEAEIVARAESIAIDDVGPVPVARAEELLAMKVLAMDDRRLQDRLDALALLAFNPELDRDAVRNALAMIEARGFQRGQDLGAKLDALFAEHARS